MNTTLRLIFSKLKNKDKPIEIPNVGRDDLATWLYELDFKTGVEVGVAAGEYSLTLCEANPQMELIGVDAYQAYSSYRDYSKKSTFEKLEKEAKEKLSGFENYTFVKKWSMDAVKDFKNESLDFVYIDANHQDPYVSEDIKEWSQKVRTGGIVAGHDFIKTRAFRCDVKEAVKNHVKERNIKFYFVLGLNGKIPGMKRENTRSWMYVKEG